MKYPRYHTILYQVEEGDLLTLLNVYYAFHNRGGSDWSKAKHWCAGHFLRYKALKRFELSIMFMSCDNVFQGHRFKGTVV